MTFWVHARTDKTSCLFVFFMTAKEESDKNNCSLPVEEAGIIWDSICFLCLLLQRRVFLSFYFLHVVAELQASAKQASRYEIPHRPQINSVSSSPGPEEQTLISCSFIPDGL